jgi:hypothetical protein
MLDFIWISDSGAGEGDLAIVSADPDGMKPLIRYPNETVSFRMTVKVPNRLKVENGVPLSVEAEVVTNLVDTINKNGDWVAHKMAVEPIPTPAGSRSWRRPETDSTPTGTFQIIFFVMLHPTTIGKYHYKLRTRVVNSNDISTGDYYYFGGDEKKEFKLRVLDLEIHSATWTSGPNAIEVHPNVFVGNFMAACNAQQLGFTAILNVAEELDVPLEKFASPVPSYKKIGLTDGTANAISPENILACVRWLEAKEGSKILIHCRAGIGRSGSIAIAYKCKKFPLLSYDEVTGLIWKAKPDITPHKGLKQTVESIKWE